MEIRNAIGSELYEDFAPLVDTWGDSFSVATHPAVVASKGPYSWWRFGEPTGTVADDEQNVNDGTYTGGVTLGQPSLFDDNNTAALFNGSTGEVTTAIQQINPTVFSIACKFLTTTGAGGCLIGFIDAQTGGGSSHDRMIWMSDNGRLNFGVWVGSSVVISTTTSYNDGKPHYAIATVAADKTMALYVDGVLAASGAYTGNTIQPYNGWWRIGRTSSFSGWPFGSSSAFFAGVIDEPAVYYTTLDEDDAADLWSATKIGDLEVFCHALGWMIQPVDDICKDGPNGEPGWSQVLDLVRAKDEWLPWLGQWTGYLVPAKAAVETQAAWSARERTRIVSRAANRRGTIALLREIIQEHLGGTKTVIIQERSADAHTMNVYVYNSEIITSTALVTAAAQAAKAYGLILVFNVLTGANYTLLQASNASYTIMTGKHANYNSVLTNPGL